MTNSRVLIICYYFPPIGGAGIGRPLTLFKRLSDHGITCDILTVKPVAYRLHEPELLQGLDSNRIYRAGSRDPQRLMRVFGLKKVKDSIIRRGKTVSDRFFPDPKVGWVKPAINLGRVLSENKNYDGIVSTSPPISSHLVAKTLATEFHIPWIADFRDFWTGYKAEHWFQNRRHIERAKQLLTEITDSATEVSVVNPAIKEYLGRGTVIFNSYDENRASRWTPPQNSDVFRIGILGTIDELRPIGPLLRLLDTLRKDDPAMGHKIRLVQVGTINDPDFAAQILNHDLGSITELHGLLSRQETIRILSESHMLYIGLASPHGEGVVPGRLFDMIASGRVLLGAVPKGSVVETIVNKTGNGFCYNNENVSGALVFLKQAISRKESGSLNITPVPAYAHPYSSSEMTRQFASLIRKLTKPAC